MRIIKKIWIKKLIYDKFDQHDRVQIVATSTLTNFLLKFLLCCLNANS